MIVTCIVNTMKQKITCTRFLFLHLHKEKGKKFDCSETSNSVHKLAQSDRKSTQDSQGLNLIDIFFKITEAEIPVDLFNFYPGVFPHKNMIFFPKEAGHLPHQ